MGAYNAVNGLPCCANPMLLHDILRDQWGFDGYVVADVGAPVVALRLPSPLPDLRMEL